MEMNDDDNFLFSFEENVFLWEDIDETWDGWTYYDEESYNSPRNHSLTNKRYDPQENIRKN